MEGRQLDTNNNWRPNPCSETVLVDGKDKIVSGGIEGSTYIKEKRNKIFLKNEIKQNQ